MSNNNKLVKNIIMNVLKYNDMEYIYAPIHNEIEIPLSNTMYAICFDSPIEQILSVFDEFLTNLLERQ